MKHKFDIITEKKKIIKILNDTNIKNIVFPGGSSIVELFNKINIKIKKNVFITDERVCFNQIERLNSQKIKKLIKNKKVILKNKIFDLPNSNNFIKRKFKHQFNKFNFKKSILLIGFGLDGHYCSIFKKANFKSNFFISKKKLENFERISITSKLIKRFPKKNIYFLAFGKKKGLKFKEFLLKKDKYPITQIINFSQKIICNYNFKKYLN